MQDVVGCREVISNTTNVYTFVGKLFASSFPGLTLHCDGVVFTGGRNVAKDFLVAFDYKIASPFLLVLAMSYKLLGAETCQAADFGSHL